MSIRIPVHTSQAGTTNSNLQTLDPNLSALQRHPGSPADGQGPEAGRWWRRSWTCARRRRALSNLLVNLQQHGRPSISPQYTFPPSPSASSQLPTSTLHLFLNTFPAYIIIHLIRVSTRCRMARTKKPISQIHQYARSTTTCSGDAECKCPLNPTLYTRRCREQVSLKPQTQNPKL